MAEAPDAGDPPTTMRPNVIFILVDDLGWGDLGVFHQNSSTHDRKLKTPFLDKMAGEGMQLRAHYCPAPVCAPSRASLFSGVHQGHATVRDNQFDKALSNNHTLASVMKTAGYRTALIGKYGLQGNDGTGPDSWTGYPTKRGFDEFFGYASHVAGHIHYPADHWPLGNSDSHQTPKLLFWNDKEVSKDYSKCYTTDLFTARSKAWIAEQCTGRPDQPFFLCLTYDTPHAALQVPTCEYPAGKGLAAGVQWTGKPGSMINTAVGEIDSWRHPDYLNLGWTDIEERFATMVRRIDNAIGDLVQTLKDLGIAENTMVVFTSDNGPHHESYLASGNHNADSFQSYGPYDGTKRDTWEGGIRMPTLTWWPGHIPSGVEQASSQFHDWMPTIAELGGIEAPARTDGVSLLPSLTKTGEQLAGTVYVEYRQHGKTMSYEDFLSTRRGAKRGQMQVIQLEGYKGVRTDISSADDDFEIYDVRTDPGERKNLLGTSEKFRLLNERMQERVLRLRVANESAKRPYDDAPVPGYALATVQKQGVDQIKWATYASGEGGFPFVPHVRAMQPTETGVVSHEKQSAIPVVSGAVHIERWIEITDDEKECVIAFSCPTKGFVRLHDAAIADADFGYAPNSTIKRTVHLGKGWHPLRMTVLADADGKASYVLTVE